MVKTSNITMKENSNSYNSNSSSQTEQEEFMYEIELNKRIVNRKRRNALDTQAIFDLQNFMKEMENKN